MVVLGEGGKYLSVDVVQPGDTVEFLNEGEWIENTKFPYPDGNPRQDFVMKVGYNGESYLVRINKFSKDELLPVYGRDTAKWVGKKARISIENYRSLNKKGIILTPIKEDIAAAQKEKEREEIQSRWDEA